MDVRDYFAGKALSGLMQEDQDLSKGKNIRKLAATSYQIADAMLEARERPSQPVLLMEEPRQEAAANMSNKDGTDSKKNKKGKKAGDKNGNPGS